MAKKEDSDKKVEDPPGKGNVVLFIPPPFFPNSKNFSPFFQFVLYSLSVRFNFVSPGKKLQRKTHRKAGMRLIFITVDLGKGMYTLFNSELSTGCRIE